MKLPQVRINVRLVALAVYGALLVVAGCSLPGVAEPAAPGDTDRAAAPPVGEPTPQPGSLRPKPFEAIERVLIISIDGLRPDLALRAYMPRLRRLCQEGSYTFWAETAAEAYTLPCHVSMLTGVSSDKHGVTWNEYIEEAYPNVPTLFELAKEVGYSTGMATGKMKFITVLKPRAEESSVGNARVEDQSTDHELLFQQPAFQASNTVDHYYLPATEQVADHEVAAEAVRLLRDYRPEVFLVHFPGVDTVGHERGWGTPEQIVAIEQADAAMGQVLDALAELDLAGSTLVIVTADHGGAGTDHKAGDPRAHFIPWIVSGPGIRHDYDLTLIERTIHIEDTFATACAFLGVVPSETCDGTTVLEILEP